jgi:hypothetical protein
LTCTSADRSRWSAGIETSSLSSASRVAVLAVEQVVVGGVPVLHDLESESMRTALLCGSWKARAPTGLSSRPQGESVSYGPSDQTWSPCDVSDRFPGAGELQRWS